jgi:hypothetical protein
MVRSAVRGASASSYPPGSPSGFSIGRPWPELFRSRTFLSPIAGFVLSASRSRRKCNRPDESPAITVRPSGATAQLVMLSSPVKETITSPLSRSKTNSVCSLGAQTARHPSDVIATPLYSEQLWPSSVRRLWPLSSPKPAASCQQMPRPHGGHPAL